MLLGIHPSISKSYVNTETCTISGAALFIIVKNWKQPRCISIEEWINRLCISPPQFIKKKGNELWIHTITQMNHKCILQSEGSQTQKATYCVIICVQLLPGKAKLQGQKTDHWMPGEWGRE